MLHTSISDVSIIVTEFSKISLSIRSCSIIRISLHLSLSHWFYYIYIINLSLITTVVPQSMKYSYITPLLKKPTLYHSNLANYRPISQLSSMSKTLERVFSSQLIQYITSNNIVDCFQSAYIPHRSTDIALHLIISEILLSLDAKNPCYLVLLDLS